MKMGKDFNASVEVLFNKVDDLVSTKTVVGEAIVIGDITLLPLIEVAVGVGAGAKEDSNAAGGMGIVGFASGACILFIRRRL